MLTKIIFYSFCPLFFLTPLFWNSNNFELFEYNKMILTYFLTVVITGTWLIRMIQEKSFIFRRTPLDIPLVLFLISQIISTIISIDPHTSLYGYYSRSNGGLLSIICYTLLYWALVSNLDKEKVINLLKAGLLGGLLVSLWAIPEHFGISPSCAWLRGELNADCWIQDVQSRVFATLGQPNWLAAYLGMMLFPALYFFLTSKTQEARIFFYTFLVAFYMAFTFTYSRGGTFGLLAGLLTFGAIYFGKNFIFNLFPTLSYSKQTSKTVLVSYIKPILVVLVSFLVINLLFGSALTRFQFAKLLPSTTSATDQPTTTSGLTQLENGGTESGKIRLIVWQGAWDIFKHYPLFGSGVETFAYSYYQYRPAAHNMVSEWDFLYNKAHNEYLNYLATTGIFGLGTYMLMILTFLGLGIKYLVFNKHNIDNKQFILGLTMIGAYVSYLIQNIFGFSVVIIAIFFFLFPAIFFVAFEKAEPLKFPKSFNSVLILLRSVFSHTIVHYGLQLVVVFFMLFFLVQTYLLWYADTLFAQGQRSSEAGQAGSAYNYLSQAVIYNDREPYYKSELGYAAATAAVAFKDEDATLSAKLKQQAISETQKALEISPKNVSYYRTAILTNYNLAALDPTFMNQTLQSLDKAISLAPTDSKLLYNKAIMLGQIDRNEDAIENLKKAIDLKQNYRESYIALGLFYFDEKKYEQAVDYMRRSLQLVPNDSEVLQYLENWGKEGIATESGKKK